MSNPRQNRRRVPLSAFFVLMLGIAIGYSLNLEMLRSLFGHPVESRMVGLPTYLIEPPDVLLVHATAPGVSRAVVGEHLVGPDGCVHLGAYGRVYVTGMTVEQAGAAIARATGSDDDTGLWLEVLSYNSKAYYVINRTPGGDAVLRMPVTGNETVLDALASTATKYDPAEVRLSIQRPATNGSGDTEVLPVRWDAASGGIAPSRNYQLYAGDRVIVEPASAPQPGESK